MEWGSNLAWGHTQILNTSSNILNKAAATAYWTKPKQTEKYTRKYNDTEHKSLDKASNCYTHAPAVINHCSPPPFDKLRVLSIW